MSRTGLDTQGMKNAYLRSLHTRRLSETTIRSARSILTIVEAYTAKRLEHCGPDDLRRWHERRADELSERSLRTQISYVRNAYAWGVLEDFVRVDPSLRLRPPKVPQTLPRPIPEGRLARAWLAADDRMRLILALAAFAGLRACEIASLDWANVYLDDPAPYFRTVGKGKKERALDISPDLADALERMPHRRGPVVRRSDGQPGHNTPTRISKLANEHLHASGAPDTLHSLRHRFLSELCREAGIRVAQEAAGHASPVPTALYTKVHRTDMRPSVVKVGRLLLNTEAS